ncbi:MAG: sulfur carrier protein ThiS [Acidobacteriota bacterium]
MISVRINGQSQQLEEPIELPALVTQYAGTEDREGIAVGINRNVIPRDEWDAVRIQDGDEIEIIAPFAGG